MVDVIKQLDHPVLFERAHLFATSNASESLTKMYDKWAKMLYGTFAHINVSKTG